jgi:lysophospholipase L1-like esterase
MNNKLHYSFLLCLAIIGLLFILYLLPEFSIGSMTFKKIDLLANIREPQQDSVFALNETEIADSIVAKQDSIVKEIKEHCKPGITCIEDYSSDSTALKNFFKALTQTKKNGTPLRIAFYGDSFIEGDVFCGSFRDTLQSLFGGRGVGYVPITSDVAGFRNTIKHRFDNWVTSSLIVKKDSTAKLGPSGFCFIPKQDNWVEYAPSRQRYLNEFKNIKLYYKNLNSAILHYKIDTLESIEPLNTSDRLQEWTYSGNHLKYVKFQFDPFDSLWLYGASFEGDGGIYVDNFSMRGNSGMNLTAINSQMYRDFNKYRNYKLIILQFGLNLVVEENLNYQAYTKRMVNVVQAMKKLFPNSSFLLLSISDRSSNANGEYQTMKAIPAMRNAQRLIAKETGIAFWDMFQAMGGENSMVKLAEAKPPQAAKDYTHLNFKGGKKLSGALVKSLLFEHEKYAKQ